MKTWNRIAVLLTAAAGLGATLALAQPKDKGQPEKNPAAMQLPPGVTAEDMQACQDAATPGPMHEWMGKCTGTYQGKVKMWMSPEAPAQEFDCTTTISSLYGGKFLKVESKGEMMGMPFEGTGVYGFDNVSKQFQSVWFDNMGTGMITGTGSLSEDGHVLTLNEKFNCPIQKKCISMREVQTYHADGSMTLEMFGPDKSGKEFREMEITYKSNKGEGKPSASVPADR